MHLTTVVEPVARLAALPVETVPKLAFSLIETSGV
jgi:hypothetical protein